METLRKVEILPDGLPKVKRTVGVSFCVSTCFGNITGSLLLYTAT